MSKLSQAASQAYVFSYVMEVGLFAYYPKAKHCFMSELVAFKQKFLMEAFKGTEFEDCCLFSDATKVFTDDRDCVRHKDSSRPSPCEPLF